MILETGINNIIDIYRMVRKINGTFEVFESSEIEYVFINSFESIDCDNFEVRIIINSNLHYKCILKGKNKDFISSLIKPEIRDQKIDTILS